MTNKTTAASPVAAMLGSPACSPDSDLLRPEAAAERLGVTERMLARWRAGDEGPAFVRLTRKTIRYRAADLDAFVAGRVFNGSSV